MNRSSADTLAAFSWLEAFGQAMEAELDEVYGGTERRISCESALARTAFTAIPLGCENASAPAPETDIAQFKGRALFHYFEPAATLKAGAAQIGERTWISAASRAMLDVASVSTDYRATEYLIKAAMRTDIPTDEMIGLAEQIGQQVGLRRIAAVCSLIEEQHRRVWPRPDSSARHVASPFPLALL